MFTGRARRFFSTARPESGLRFSALPPFPGTSSPVLFIRVGSPLHQGKPAFFSSVREPSFVDHRHRRSVGFLQRDAETWACFLVTFRDRGGRWHGYFSFRPRDGEAEEDEIRTADIFLEDSESEIDQKARSLGRPLLSGLLASALHTRERMDDTSPRLRRWFRTMLKENSQGIAGDWPEGEEEMDLAKLRSLYASYRLDQVCHFIALVRPEDFQEAVDRILEGAAVDFSARDRLQFAMIVVEFIENLLELPPFEVWAEDFMAHRTDYALYAHTLHREGRLP